MPYKAAPPDLLATQHSAWVITCYLPFFAVRCSEASAGQTRRFLPWIVTNLSTFLAGRPLARQHGQRAGTDPTSPSPFAPASRRAEARARAAQPCGAGGSHPVPTSPGRKYMQSPPRRKKKKKATSPYPLPTPLLLLGSKTRSLNAMKNGKNTSSSISQANRRDLHFRSSQLLPFTADKIQPHPEHRQIPRCLGEAQCKALEAPVDAGRRRKKETSKPRELIGKSMMRRQHHFEFKSDAVKVLEENGIWSSAKTVSIKELTKYLAQLPLSQPKPGFHSVSSNNFF